MRCEMPKNSRIESWKNGAQGDTGRQLTACCCCGGGCWLGGCLFGWVRGWLLTPCHARRSKWCPSATSSHQRLLDLRLLSGHLGSEDELAFLGFSTGFSRGFLEVF